MSALTRRTAISRGLVPGLRRERPGPGRGRGARRVRIGLLFVSPWIIGFCGFYLYPFFATLYYSFTSFTGIGNPTFTGLANFDALIAMGDLAEPPPLAGFVDASFLAEATAR